MQATYRPGTRVSARWLGADAEAPVPIPFLDEDEATLAVAAAAPLLARAGLAANQLRRVSISGRTGTGFGPVLAAALGSPPERVEEGAAILYGQTAAGNPGEGPVLHVHADAPRPGRVPPDGVGAGAYATARLTGPGVPDWPPLELAGPARTLERDVVEELARWERDAPSRTTMGAHVPRGTWERGARARYHLEGSRCADGHTAFPPRPACPACGAAAAAVALPREGTVETFTVVAKGAGPTEFEPLQSVQGEYGVAVANFGGARVPGILADAPASVLRVGLRVGTVFRRLYGQDGEWRYGLKLRPA